MSNVTPLAGAGAERETVNVNVVVVLAFPSAKLTSLIDRLGKGAAVQSFSGDKELRGAVGFVTTVKSAALLLVSTQLLVRLADFVALSAAVAVVSAQFAEP